MEQIPRLVPLLQYATIEETVIEGDVSLHTYCVIPDTSADFWAFAETMPELAKYKTLLIQSQIQKVEVDTVKNTWIIHLIAHPQLPAKILDFAGDYLTKHCGLSKVSFTSLTANTMNEEELLHYLHSYRHQIIDSLSGEHLVKRLLSQANWNYNGETIILETSSRLSADILSERMVEKMLENYILSNCGCNCRVSILCNEADAPCSPCEESILTPEYLEALDQHASSADIKPKAANSIIFGRTIKGEPQPIASITEEAKNIIISGELITFDLRSLRSGRFLLTFDLDDMSDGISGKAFFDDQEQFNKITATLSEGMLVKVKGTVQYDKYNSELVLFADSMCSLAKTERVDSAHETRVELHAHTRISTLDAVVSVKSLIRTAAKWKHSAIAITDHGVVQAFPEAHEEASKAGIKVIYGMEGYLFENDINSANHVIILAQNTVGLKNLYRLVSISHLKYLHRTPRIPKAVLSDHREGLIIGSACEAGELIQAILQGKPEEDLLRIAAFYDYLEIQPTANNLFLVRQNRVSSEEDLRQINRTVCRLGDKLNKRVVATCDVHFLNPEDEVYRRILMAGQGFSDADLQPPLFFRTTDEMVAEFNYLGKEKAKEIVIDNSRFISSLIEDFKPIPDELYSPQIPGAEDQITTMSYNKAKTLYGDTLPKLVQDRLQYELDGIINNGFAVLYLIAHKLVKKSLDDGYLVGSRGSVGSSFVATMTDITEVNPLPPHWRCSSCKYSEFVTDGSYGCGFDLPDKECPNCHSKLIKDGHDIPFAVFMGFHGDKVPDIDLNFSGDYQPVAHKYTEELFGKDNVFRAGTIATIAEKTAYGFVKNYFSDKGLTTRNAHINKLVKGCTGVKRTTGQHPGGIMVVPRDMDIHHFTPIQYPADDKNSNTITTHFDYHSISSRLVKLDILGHDDPTVIKMLEDLTGVDAKSIPFDDKDTMSLFSSTEALRLPPEQLGSPVGTFGIPEFGTKFVRQMLEDTMPHCFSELVRISGFSHGTDVWLNNAQDLIRNGTAKLSEAISARDDIMVYLIHKGVDPQLAFKTMEGVRKGKGIKSDDIPKLQEKEVPDWYIESCQKIKYMFPKAHAVAYVMMAFRIAWFKVHHPLAFYASYFSVRATEFDANLIAKGETAIRSRMAEIDQKGVNASPKEKGLLTILEMALEMYLRGFHFHRVDLYQSDATRFLIVGGGLLPPLAALEGLGNSAANNIVLARFDKPFSSIEDLRTRGRASKTVIDILKDHGCIDNLPETDQMMLFA
jgi:DNA polymerase-3 subunit alpha (Gram-positive type)